VFVHTKRSSVTSPPTRWTLAIGSGLACFFSLGCFCNFGAPEIPGFSSPAVSYERVNATRTGVLSTEPVRELTTLEWKFMTESAIKTSPVVSDGVIFFGSNDNSVYAVELENGLQK